MRKKNEDKIPKWIVDEENLIFGPRQSYPIHRVFIFAVTLQVLGICFVILMGTHSIPVNRYAEVLCQLFGFAVFLYGVHIHKIVRAAKEIMKERKAGLHG